MLTQFTSTNSGPYYFCMAVSKGGNPVSSGWWIYRFQTPNNRFPDYLKFAVWADGYYMTANEFGDVNTDNGVGLWAIDRTPMLTGATDRPSYQKVGIKTYGLDPFKVERADAQRGVHGNNERLSLENVGFGVRYVYDILRYAQ